MTRSPFSEDARSSPKAPWIRSRTTPSKERATDQRTVPEQQSVTFRRRRWVVMGYDYDGGASSMWGFGGLMLLGLLILIGLAVWAVLTVARCEDRAAAGLPTVDGDPRSRTRQVL